MIAGGIGTVLARTWAIAPARTTEREQTEEVGVSLPQAA
jgi:hypothetical protein